MNLDILENLTLKEIIEICKNYGEDVQNNLPIQNDLPSCETFKPIKKYTLEEMAKICEIKYENGNGCESCLFNDFICSVSYVPQNWQIE